MTQVSSTIAAAWPLSAAEMRSRLMAEGVLPFVVGGTGLYIKALVYGLFEGRATDPEARQRTKAQLAQEGAAFHLGVDGENLGEPRLQAGEDQVGKIPGLAAVKTQKLIQGGQGGGDFQYLGHRIPEGREIGSGPPGVAAVKKIPGCQHGAAVLVNSHN